MMKILLLANGDYGDYGFCQEWTEYELIIAADNGMKHAKKLGITPHYLIGDFDSCTQEDLAYFQGQNCKIIQKPTTKDETDTELALDLAIQKGASHITIYGGIGSRFDHSFANVQLLYKALQRNISAVLLSPENTIYLMTKGTLRLQNKGGYVSLLPFSQEVKGITTTGLAYTLVNATLTQGDVVGVSNYMVQSCGEISVGEGVLLVIQAQD